MSRYRPEKESWEQSQFPILCETCLGENPYMRMMVDKLGQACKICNRPFTTYRWCPGPRMRFKKTEICQTCSRAKNVCQTCLLDLTYNLPVQARDKLLQVNSEIPRSDVNREYHTQILEKKINEQTADQVAEPLNPALAGSSKDVGKVVSPGSMTLTKFSRRAPYYRRNLPHICSFWLKGECKRGSECPYRHEKASDPDDPLSNQNMKDRYYGTRDPVAQKILNRVAEEGRKEKSVREPTEFKE